MGVLEDKRRARFFYKYLSKVYNSVNSFIFTKAMRAEALEMLDLQGEEYVLDVGCGTGFGTEGLLAYTDDVVGVDQSPHQLEKAIERLQIDEEVVFTMGDAERLPFRTDSFDAAWSSGSIEYWPDPVEGLREMARVVKPGGRVLVIGPNYPKTRLGQRLADAIMLFYQEEEIDEMFAEAGYEDVAHELLGPRYKSDLAIASVGTVPLE